MKSLKEIKDKYVILSLIALQLIVTLPFINSFPIDLDEPFSIFYAQQDLRDLFKIFVGENNPPLHFVLLHFWTKLFGIGPVAVRSLSLLFSILTIPVLYHFSKKIVKKELAILTVSFFIFSSLMHYHSLEARTYSLLVLLTLLVFNELFNLVFNLKFSYIKLGILNALLLYTHYISGYIIITELIVLFYYIIKRFKLPLIKLFIAYSITLILYLPGIWIFIERLKHFSSQGTWVPKPHWIDLMSNIFKFFNKEFAFLVILIFCLYFIILSYKKKTISIKINDKQQFIFIVFIVNYFGLFLFSILFQPVFLDRYILFIVPFFYMLISIFISIVIPKNFNYGYLLIILLPFIFYMKILPNNNRDGDKIVAKIHELTKSKDSRIFICPPWYNLTFYYHFDKNLFKDYSKIDHLQAYKNIQPVYHSDEIKEDDLKQQVFFIDAQSEFVLKDNNIFNKLNEIYTLKSKTKYKGDYYLYEFEK